jgi:hypothetical protein
MTTKQTQSTLETPLRRDYGSSDLDPAGLGSTLRERAPPAVLAFQPTCWLLARTSISPPPSCQLVVNAGVVLSARVLQGVFFRPMAV